MTKKANENSTPYEKTYQFSCPSCGGHLLFNPENQSLECSYCEKKMELKFAKEEITEYDFLTASKQPQTDWGENKKVVKCQNCGFEIVLGEHVTAQFCSFCGSSYILSTNESEGIAPESLVPFKVSKNKALENFSLWLKKRYFAPSDLTEAFEKQKLTGVYIPFWTYDTDTYSTYTAEAGTYYYVTVSYQSFENGKPVTKYRQERRIRWRYVEGDYTSSFDDILINASREVNFKLIEDLKPYNLNELVKYKPEYLSGFGAEKYSIDLKEGFKLATEKIDSRIYSGIEEKINADTLRNLRVNISYRNIKYKHLLLPVWMSSYTYKKKAYQYLVNGQTGEVKGQAPVSAFKITVLVIVIILAIIFLILKFQ